MDTNDLRRLIHNALNAVLDPKRSFSHVVEGDGGGGSACRRRLAADEVATDVHQLSVQLAGDHHEQGHAVGGVAESTHRFDADAVRRPRFDAGVGARGVVGRRVDARQVVEFAVYRGVQLAHSRYLR